MKWISYLLNCVWSCFTNTTGKKKKNDSGKCASTLTIFEGKNSRAMNNLYIEAEKQSLPSAESVNQRRAALFLWNTPPDDGDSGM